MKSKIGILMAACSLLITSLSFAQDTTTTAKGQRRFGQGQGFEQGPGMMTPKQRAKHFIQRWDKDGDGKLDQAELTAAFEEKQEHRAEKKGEKSATTPTPKPTP